MYANLLLHLATDFVILFLLDNGVTKTSKRLCITKSLPVDYYFKLSFSDLKAILYITKGDFIHSG